MGQQVAEAAQVDHVLGQPAPAPEPERDAERGPVAQPGPVADGPEGLDEAGPVGERGGAQDTRGEHPEPPGREPADQPLGQDRQPLLQVLVAGQPVVQERERLGASVGVGQDVRPDLVRQERPDARGGDLGRGVDQQPALRHHQARGHVGADLDLGRDVAGPLVVAVEVGPGGRGERRRPDNLLARDRGRAAVEGRHHVARERHQLVVGGPVEAQARR